MSVKFLLRRAAAVAPYCVLLLLPRFACGHASGQSRLDPPQPPQLLHARDARVPLTTRISRQQARGAYRPACLPKNFISIWALR